MRSEQSNITALSRTCPSCNQEYPWREAHQCAVLGREVAPSMDLVGTTIEGRYQVQGRLGEGGMGIVYRARHIHLEKTVAIKVLRNTQDKEAWARFKQEAKSASAVNHSNIVAITDFGVLPDGHAYIVMELLEGRTLTDAISRRPIGTLRALNIAVQVARGLSAVHDAGIIHRDLKPDNVFLQDKEGQKDQVKIMDFGVAKVESSARLTAHGMVMGTAEYISPEQAAGRTIDPRCDQYALGCILYEMLTGEQVFRADTAPVLMKMHVYDQPVPPTQRKPEAEIPPSVEAICLRMLRKRPEERFASMAEVEQVLQAEIRAMEQEPMTGMSLPRMVISGARRSRALILGVGAAVLVIGGVLWFIGQSSMTRKPPPPPAPAMAEGKPVVTAPKAAKAEAAPAPPAAAPDRPRAGRPARKGEAAPAGPLQVHFMPQKPAEVTLTCTGLDQKVACRAGCNVTIPAGSGTCVASADGFASKPFNYSLLQGMRKKSKGPVKQKVVLVDLRNR